MTSKMPVLYIDTTLGVNAVAVNQSAKAPNFDQCYIIAQNHVSEIGMYNGMEYTPSEVNHRVKDERHVHSEKVHMGGLGMAKFIQKYIHPDKSVMECYHMLHDTFIEHEKPFKYEDFTITFRREFEAIDGVLVETYHGNRPSKLADDGIVAYDMLKQICGDKVDLQ